MGRGVDMTIPPYICQGLIAGLSGSTAAVISVYLEDRIRRMHNHLILHQENFEVLKAAIKETYSEVYPYFDNKEIPPKNENFEVNCEYWKDYSILNHKDVIIKDEKTYEIRAINKLLCYDIAIHWPEFYEKLDKWSKKIKEKGIRSNEIMKAIFGTIWKKIRERKLNCDFMNEKNLVKGPGAMTDDCVMVAYNFVMDPDRNERTNNYTERLKQTNNYTERLKLIDTLKEIANEVRREREKDLEDFNKKIVPFLKTAKELIEELDELILERRIKHSCKYI